MRILLEKGKQKQLILEAKKDRTWKELANKLNISYIYLINEIVKEKRLLSENNYKLICNLINENYDKFIVKKLEDNWGRSKGGKNSPKNMKRIIIPKEDENLAEVFGIILGDGHISEIKEGTKKRCYSIRIAGNAETDIDYLASYIPSLFERVFNERGKVHFSKKTKAGWFTLYGKEYVDFMKLKGVNSGNKKKNNQGIPQWIIKNDNYLKKCLRGLIDTDGSVHYISKTNKGTRISYTSVIPELLNNVRNSFIKLGFNPSKIISNKQIFLSRKDEILKYQKEIGFRNQKNLNRLKSLQKKRALFV